MFTHLHVHSNYSLLGATASVEQLVQRANEEGMTHLALTDRNALYGAVAFARACPQVGITPLIGMTVTVRPQAQSGVLMKYASEVMTLIAANSDGYRSICRLSSLIQASPERIQREKQGLTWDDLAAHTSGVIALAGGRQGQLGRFLSVGDTASAARYVSRLAGLYDERAFLAVELHTAADEALAREVDALSTRFGIPAVAVQPVYCLAPSERPLLRLLAAIDRNVNLADVPAAELPDQGDEQVDLHWISLSEVTNRFAQWPHFVANVAQVITQCQPSLPDGRPIWPALNLPQNQTPDNALAAQAEQGFAKLFGADAAVGKRDRLRSELTAITRHGFSPLFLLVADIVRFARSRDIPVSTRGSVANSLVAYCIGITSVDPILHDLLFERFLSPARGEAPDIDLDFCSRRRDEVLDYVRQRHGADRVALVSTISTMRPRSALRKAAKAHGMDNDAIAKLVKMAPAAGIPTLVVAMPPRYTK